MLSIYSSKQKISPHVELMHEKERIVVYTHRKIWYDVITITNTMGVLVTVIPRQGQGPKAVENLQPPPQNSS